ncbi:MAG: TetR/AcrR family transcriptional regulator [Streptococcaceae bacterium]|jgi:AcrR family transcriptional regulator|nr:TetR/AcrR family transcriptional regulator [Streptococcaceae bacterium]
MARKKTIQREQIIDVSMQIILNHGLKSLTARRIALEMKCSTQPIYLEFKNMDELKETIFSDVFKKLEEEIYPQYKHDDPIVNLGLNYIEFAANEKRLFGSLFVEKQNNDRLLKFSDQYFRKILKTSVKYKDLPDETVRSLLYGTWIIATGIAIMSSTEVLIPDDAKTIQMIQDGIAAMMQLKSPLFSRIG